MLLQVLEYFYLILFLTIVALYSILCVNWITGTRSRIVWYRFMKQVRCSLRLNSDHGEEAFLNDFQIFYMQSRELQKTHGELYYLINFCYSELHKRTVLNRWLKFSKDEKRFLKKVLNQARSKYLFQALGGDFQVHLDSVKVLLESSRVPNWQQPMSNLAESIRQHEKKVHSQKIANRISWTLGGSGVVVGLMSLLRDWILPLIESAAK